VSIGEQTWGRSQRWFARGVFACGAIAVVSVLAVPAVCNPEKLNDPVIWFAAWLLVFPFIWIGISIRNGRRTQRFVWGVRLAALPVVLLGLRLTLWCLGVIEAHLSGRELKDPLFGLEWLGLFLLVAYFFGFLTARLAYGPPPEPGRGIFLHLGETGDANSKE
jgi:hypothetical protein